MHNNKILEHKLLLLDKLICFSVDLLNLPIIFINIYILCCFDKLTGGHFMKDT